MSTADDRQVLMEYIEWVDRDRDNSIDAFLREREDEANTKRVAEALTRANDTIAHIEAKQVARGDFGDAFEALEAIRDILQAERPWIEDGSLTGESKRVYV